jgi:hypothetical protein
MFFKYILIFSSINMGNGFLILQREDMYDHYLFYKMNFFVLELVTLFEIDSYVSF